MLRLLGWLLILLQVGWIAYGIWLVAFGTSCASDCELNTLAYWFWAGVEVLILPFAIAGAVLLRVRHE